MVAVFNRTIHKKNIYSHVKGKKNNGEKPLSIPENGSALSPINLNEVIFDNVWDEYNSSNEESYVDRETRKNLSFTEEYLDGTDSFLEGGNGPSKHSSSDFFDRKSVLLERVESFDRELEGIAFECAIYEGAKAIEETFKGKTPGQKYYLANKKLSRGCNSLHTVALLGDLDSLEILLGLGAKIIANDAGETPIHLLAMSGDEQALDLMLKRHDISECLIDHINEKSGYSPLHTALIVGHQNIARRLLLSGASVGVPSKDGIYPFELVSAIDDVELRNMLGVLHWFHFRDTNPSAYTASCLGEIVGVRAANFLSNWALNVSLPNLVMHFLAYGDNAWEILGCPLLVAAAKQEDVNTFNLLLAMGAKRTSTSGEVLSEAAIALLEAPSIAEKSLSIFDSLANQGDCLSFEIIEDLLFPAIRADDQKALAILLQMYKREAPIRINKLVLLLAIKHNNLSAVKILADIYFSSKERAVDVCFMEQAIKSGCTDILNILLSAGFSFNDKAATFQLLMLSVVRYPNQKITSLLLSFGLDPNVTGDEAMPLLCIRRLDVNATARDKAIHAKNTELLINYGAHLDAICRTDSDGDIWPLVTAVSDNCPESVALLIRAGASIHVNCTKRGSVLHQAVMISDENCGALDDHVRVLNILLEAGANAEKVCLQNGFTPALLLSQMAAWHGKSARIDSTATLMLDSLFSSGINLEAMDYRCRTILDIIDQEKCPRFSARISEVYEMTA